MGVHPVLVNVHQTTLYYQYQLDIKIPKNTIYVKLIHFVSTQAPDSKKPCSNLARPRINTKTVQTNIHQRNNTKMDMEIMCTMQR